MLRFATKLAPTQERLELAWKIGFKNAEFWLNKSMLSDGAAITARAREFSMRYVPHFPNHGELSEKHLENLVGLYRDLDCRAMVIHPPMLRRYGERLFQLEPDLRLGVENARQRLPDFWKWAEENDGLTLDVEHVWKYTLRDAPLDQLLATISDFLQRYHAKLRHVHLPGYVIGEPEHRPAYFNPELVREIWNLLGHHGFEGLIVSEADVEFQTGEHLRRDIELFREWSEGKPGESRKVA